VVICLEQGADLHVAQLMPRPLTVSCFSKIEIGITFLVPAHPIFFVDFVSLLSYALFSKYAEIKALSPVVCMFIN